MGCCSKTDDRLLQPIAGMFVERMSVETYQGESSIAAVGDSIRKASSHKITPVWLGSGSFSLTNASHAAADLIDQGWRRSGTFLYKV